MPLSDRFPYKTAVEYNQDFLDLCYFNTTTELRLIADIETPNGNIKVSDRNFYVGGDFYEARVRFPSIERKLDDWLSWRPEANTLELEISNADGKFSDLLAGGTAFGLWIGKKITIKVGLRDVASSYKVVYSGFVSEVGGLIRKSYSFILNYEDYLSKTKVELPPKTFQREDFPDLEGRFLGRSIPLIYGNWMDDMPLSGVMEEGNGNVLGIPTTVVNGGLSLVDTTIPIEVVASNYYVLDVSNNVYVDRFGAWYKINPDDVTVTNYGAIIAQNTGNTVIEGENYVYLEDDRITVAVKNILPNLDNPVSQCKHLMIQYCGYEESDFTTAWQTFDNLFKENGVRESLSRIAVYDPVQASRYCSVLLGQVQLQMYINAEGKIDLFSNDLEDFKLEVDRAAVKQADIVQNSLTVQLRDGTSFNRARASFAYNPIRRENYLYTRYWKNTLSVDAIGKEVTETTFQFPNLYKREQVEYHLHQILKLSSSFFEEVEVGLTWRHMLQDLGGFTKQVYVVSQLEFKETPAIFRSIRHNTDYSLTCTIWCLQQVPFGEWVGGTGSVGGDVSVIEAG